MGLDNTDISDFREKLLRRLDLVEDLPTLPSVIFNLEVALKDEESGAEEVARIMTEDPSLTSKVLRLANSPYFQPVTGPVSSVAAAIARLGFREVGRLCTTVAIIRTFDDMGGHLDHEAFWKHSIAAGIAGRIIKRYGGDKYEFGEDEAYVAGLVHDVGGLVLDQYFPDVYVRIHVTGDEQDMSYAEVERLALKIDHGGIGAHLLEKWNIPESIVEAVRWHHQPDQARAEHRRLADVVHLADFFCTCLGVGEGSDGPMRGFSKAAWEELDLSVGDITDIIGKIDNETKNSEMFVALCCSEE